MLKNITFSAEEKLIESAHERAQQERTTLNNVFRDWLARYTAKGSAPGRYRELMCRMKHVSAGRRFFHEELNER